LKKKKNTGCGSRKCGIGPKPCTIRKIIIKHNNSRGVRKYNKKIGGGKKDHCFPG